jgi:hypothetical protein
MWLHLVNAEKYLQGIVHLRHGALSGQYGHGVIDDGTGRMRDLYGPRQPASGGCGAGVYNAHR